MAAIILNSNFLHGELNYYFHLEMNQILFVSIRKHTEGHVIGWEQKLSSNCIVILD
jgi:hypothetical protein